MSGDPVQTSKDLPSSPACGGNQLTSHLGFTLPVIGAAKWIFSAIKQFKE